MLCPLAVTLFASLLATQAAASPFPLSHSTAPVSDGHAPTPEEVCAGADRQVFDPKAFQLSGAARFFADFLASNGTNDWPRQLDEVTTNIPLFKSAIDCRNLGGQGCPIPTVSCGQFTPPEVWWIRVAMSKAHDFFTQSHEKLQDETIIQSLSVDQMISDFDAKTADPRAVLSSVGAALGIANVLVKRTPLGFASELGDTFSVIGSIFGIVSANSAPKITNGDLKLSIESTLIDLFKATNDQIAAFNNKLMGGDADIDLAELLKIVGSGTGRSTLGNDNVIARIFSNGAFLVPASQSDLAAGIAASMRTVKQQLVGALLKAKNFYIFVDKDRDQDACNSIKGAVFSKGECFALEQPISKRIFLGPVPHKATGPIPAQFIDHLTDPSTYDIALFKLFQSADQCKSGGPPAGLDADAFKGAENLFPTCFFNLDVIRAKGDPCKNRVFVGGTGAASGLPGYLLKACEGN
ncbi:hypothetical protein BDV95DRAFT_656744 [Massariosphaeria phaeospora]|uniref:Uncharacterized protein n=1 Tax=Massariosphaeria phaeospora TaxID=100035 RepID=A0A7C8IKB7_9PLEO|nr:hypothetical protein BDV95DRAFT_656744 [Massariosphaeria phaeospora]